MKKILIVDDSKAMRMIVARTLRQAGFDGVEVVEACNGLEALDVIAGAHPDLVLSDWNMPEMSGIELLQTLRANASTLPLGFVTSESTPEMQALAAESGALFVIVKPFTADTFQGALRPHLAA
jgi:two-component system chemotaxis response regulator CheY